MQAFPWKSPLTAGLSTKNPSAEALLLHRLLNNITYPVVYRRSCVISSRTCLDVEHLKMSKSHIK